MAEPEPIATTEDGTTPGAPPPYIQLVAASARTEPEASALLTAPDAQGRLPVMVHIGGSGTLRWEPAAAAVVVIGFVVIVAPPPGFYIGLLVVAAVMVIISLASRLFIRIPEGAAGLVSRAGRYVKTMDPGNHTVMPWFSLTHLVTRREIVFDTPVASAATADGVRVDLDALVTMRITDPHLFVYDISVSDFDQFAQAATQDAVRGLVRQTAALDTLDLGPDQAATLMAALTIQTGAFGVEIKNAAFTRVALPADLTASLEAQRLAAVQLAEEAERFTLNQRQQANRAALEAQDEEQRRASVEQEASVEDLRLKRLEARIKANPEAARYDLELQRIRVAEKLAGNTRAVVGFGGGTDLTSTILGAAEADAEAPAGGRSSRSGSR
jgi:regulator of protease activity HflC (stomatin/prohibitin superfamily)